MSAIVSETNQEDTLFDPIAYINAPRWQKVSLGLHRTEELLDKLGSPQEQLKFVHVAGTNGKGSTCAFTAQILQEAGYKVGLFTSPYLVCFEERIQINRHNIPLDKLREVTLRVKEIAEVMREHPTEFELMTAVAFTYFAQERCDVVVAEVGLGGRLDSTNVITPDVCAITSIALDHCALLGNTIEEIAAEKAGIIKKNIPVISAAQKDSVLQVFKNKADEAKADLLVINSSSLRGTPSSFSYISNGGEVYNNLALSLLGIYQIKNAVLAIEVAEILRLKGYVISKKDIINGLAHTFWPGRFERISQNPDILIDGGHNIQGAQALASCFEYLYPEKKISFIFGVLEDKQYVEMIDILLPLAKHFICFAPPNPRALSAEGLAQAIQKEALHLNLTQNLSVKSASTIPEAISLALVDATQEDVFCFCGSLYSIGEIKHNLESLGYTTCL